MAITIPNGVTMIGDEAFRNCSALAKLSLSPAVSIGENCFSDCTALITAAADKNMPYNVFGYDVGSIVVFVL